MMKVKDNTPPYFWKDGPIIIPILPPQSYIANVPEDNATLQTWDNEGNKVKLTHDFKKANLSSFLQISQIDKYLYSIIANPKTKDVGKYNATITLTDNHMYSLSTVYKLILEIKSNSKILPPEAPVSQNYFDIKIIDS